MCIQKVNYTLGFQEKLNYSDMLRTRDLCCHFLIFRLKK